MINQSTFELLKAMKLTAMANEFQHQTEDPATYVPLGFEARFLLIRNGIDARLTNWSYTSTMQLFLHQVQVSKALNTMIVRMKERRISGGESSSDPPWDWISLTVQVVPSERNIHGVATKLHILLHDVRHHVKQPAVEQ